MPRTRGRKNNKNTNKTKMGERGAPPLSLEPKRRRMRIVDACTRANMHYIVIIVIIVILVILFIIIIIVIIIILRSSFIDYPSSIIGHRASIVNRRSSILNHRLLIIIIIFR